MCVSTAMNIDKQETMYFIDYSIKEAWFSVIFGANIRIILNTKIKRTLLICANQECS